MIDPETARQAVLAWDDALDEWVGGDTSTDYVVQKAGDALAVLVPQLLDQLAGLRQENEGYDRLVIDQACERDALGERCRQAEELLSYIVDRHDAAHESAINDPLAGELVEVIVQKDWRDDAAAWFRGDIARAALGDPKETDG